MPRHASLVVGLTILILPVGTAAQDRLVDRSAFYLGLDVLVGGSAAAIHAAAAPDGPPVLEAFARGALGGAVMYGGQRLVATGVPVLRLPGVQAVAVGASMARNAGAGVPLLSDLTFLAYPFYVRVRPGTADPLTVRASAVGLVSVGWAAARNDAFDARLDWAESLLTGAPVFRSSASWIYPAEPAPAPDCAHGDGCAGGAAGLHRLGATWYTTGGRSADASRRILSHETIHLTQAIRDAALFGVPMGDAAMRRAGGIFEDAARYVAVDAFLPLSALNHALASTLPRTRHGNPWRLYEMEAKVLAGPRDQPW